MPSPETVEKAVAALKRAADYEYFFGKLHSPAWIEPLGQKGFFRRPPHMFREGEYVRFPLWPESQYLARMAAVEPQLVLSVILNMETTDNVRVHEDLVDAALAMPPAIAVRLVPIALSWIDSPYSLPLPEKLARLVVHLAQGGELGQALKLATALLRPATTDSTEADEADTYRQLRGPDPRYRIWTYERVAEAIVPALIAVDADRTIGMLSDVLQETILEIVPGASPPRDGSSMWRPAIEDSAQNSPVSTLPDVLVKLLRDGVQTHATSNPAALPALVESLDARSWAIFHRIVLHLLRTQLEQVWELARQHVLDTRRANDIDQYHEYWLLVKAMFARLDRGDQRQIIETIESGPTLVPEVEDEEYKRHYALVWQLRRLAIFKDDLGAPWRDRYDALVAQLGFEPEHPEFLSYRSGIRFGPTSPREPNDLLAMPVEEVVSYIRIWEPSGDFMTPSPEGLSRALSQAVATEPQRFSEAAAQFQGLHPTYVRGVIQGWRQAARASRPFSWAGPLQLCAWAVAQDSTVRLGGEDADLDPSWQWTRQEVAELLSTGFDQGEVAIPYGLRELVWGILEPLTSDPDPTPEHEARYGGSNMDPPTLSINTTRGEALHATIRYALWVSRETASANLATLESNDVQLPMEARQVLESHLDPSIDQSAAIRSVYGRWLPWLVLLDRSWVEQRLLDIFPEDPDFSYLRDAAWETYLRFCQPFDSVFSVIRDEYRKAVDRISASLPTGDDEGADIQLGRHLATLLLRGTLALDEQLVTDFFDRASSKVRRDTVAYVGQLIRDTPDLPTDVVERGQQLWDERLESVKAGSESERRELTAFGWWFLASNLPADWSVQQLIVTLKLTKGTVDLDSLVLERLASLASVYPEDAVEAVRLIAGGDSEGWLLSASMDHLTSILAAAISSAQPEVVEAAIDLIHLLGARGFHQLRTLLPRGDEGGNG